MTVPVVLGIDPQKKRLGLALCEFEPPHRALWADTLSIDMVDMGWRHEQITKVLRVVEVGCELNNREVVRIGIEQVPYVGNPERFRELCEVVGVIQTKAHMRWRHAVQVPLTVQAWKKAVLGNGKATKGDVWDWAADLLYDDFVTDDELNADLLQDAADGLGIAVAAAMVEVEITA